MYDYKVVERVLMTRHAVDESAKGAFRGRIQHLQRLGITPSKPGKGKRISYVFDDIAKWSFALQLEELGVDPMAIKQILDASWDRVLPAMKALPETVILFISDPCLINGKMKYYDVIEWSKLVTLDVIHRLIVINVTLLGNDLAVRLWHADHGKFDLTPEWQTGRA